MPSDGTIEKEVTGASSASPGLSTNAEAWIPGLRLRFAPASPGMTKAKGAAQ